MFRHPKIRVGMLRRNRRNTRSFPPTQIELRKEGVSVKLECGPDLFSGTFQTWSIKRETEGGHQWAMTGSKRRREVGATKGF